MQLIRFDSAAAFAERVTDFLQAREAEHNLILGLTTTLLTTNEYKLPPYLACVEKDGAMIAVAFRTPPHNLILSEIPEDHAVLDLITQDVYLLYGESLPGVSGPKTISQAFAEHWTTLTRKSSHLHMAQRIYRLDKVNAPENIPGTFRRATRNDRDLLVAWLGAFHQEAMGEVNQEQAERSVENFLTSNTRGLYLWEDNGQPVSMAGSTGPTPHGIRIGAVYTPPEFRKRGYASACVAALSQVLLDSGRKFCFLYTDLSNPTSNHIYQDIGYRPVSDVDEYHFGE
ncbi:MAG: GNAT family N-acetyltransferase [Anaerolineaceae bacterium]|nr:GNAT family N-acetyltransferase [Anaerolineaceae bacterium]